MSAGSGTIQPRIRLVSVPDRLRKLIPRNVETEHELRFLEIKGRTPALDGLIKFLRKDSHDVEKLIKNLRLQLGSKENLKNRQKVQTGKGADQKEVLEIKATRGHSRLFAFFSLDGSLIICTHTYWKSDSSKKKQNREFDRAAKLRELYITVTSKGAS